MSRFTQVSALLGTTVLAIGSIALFNPVVASEVSNASNPSDMRSSGIEGTVSQPPEQPQGSSAPLINPAAPAEAARPVTEEPAPARVPSSQLPAREAPRGNTQVWWESLIER